MNKENNSLSKIIEEKVPNLSAEEKELAEEQLSEFVDICARIVDDEIKEENKKDLNK